MSLIAAEIEKRGIATVCVILLCEIAERVRPPRALCVPFPLGYPLGGDAETQRAVIRAALGLLDDAGPAPVLKRFA
ncbi:MAG TPA: hypothetical protein VND45_07650 [Thermoanaerobaculia bacterium]|nr:hypothetical protein [Thermoanaerobaculia bacterium]